MQIIKIMAVVAAVVVCVALLLLTLGLLAFGVAADIMERQDNRTDNGERKAGKKNDREV